ncbi:Golgi-associated plant pathogenesis-related protein 1-like [Amphiura filiformis]|uniref:Golgi-associated plant pathogenesis-related protein 1-like n=1 Tax=Amphiura filiformis TaxID=82378 RepID=UPI003B20BCC6
MNWLLISVCVLQGLLLTCATQVADLFNTRGISEKTTCTTPSFPSSYNDMADFNNQALAWHNYFRCQHNAADMVLDSALQTAAQAWADEVAGSTLGTSWSVGHSPRCGVGENIWLGYGVQTPPAWKAVRGDATDPYNNYGYGWYCYEHLSYNWNSPGYTSGSGHFSQVIWNLSTKLGCGVASSSGGNPYKTIVVCQYENGGNISTDACWSGDITAMKPRKSGVTSSDVCPTGTNS